MALSDKDKKGIYIGIGVAIFFASLFVLQYVLNKSLPGENFCVENNSSRVNHTVIIDKSDDFTRGEVDGIYRFIEKEIAEDEMKEQDRLEIYILNEENFINKGYSVPESNFSKCRPRHPDDANVTIESPTILGERYTAFFDSLAGVKSILLEKGETNESPIFEMIDSVSDELNVNSENRIYIISDLLQNNRYFSQLSSESPELSTLTFDEFSSQKSGYYRSIKPKLQNSIVNILYVPREKYSRDQTLEHERFWKEFFISQNISSLDFRRL